MDGPTVGGQCTKLHERNFFRIHITRSGDVPYITSDLPANTDNLHTQQKCSYDMFANPWLRNRLHHTPQQDVYSSQKTN
jgi:hypothetical protein